MASGAFGHEITMTVFETESFETTPLKARVIARDLRVLRQQWPAGAMAVKGNMRGCWGAVDA